MKVQDAGNYSIDDYKKMFGRFPSDSDLKRITQAFMEAYHRLNVDPYELVHGFGVDWLELLLKFNEKQEEYELCAIFRDLINDYKQK
jgi:hypothetical protein